MTLKTTALEGQLALPRPQRLVLYNFSLYDQASTIEAEFGDGVFCLAGANGLGKSTFLAALNYAITGIVPDASRRFESTPEYYRKSLPYSAEFFRGRIAEADSDAAQVELEMLVGQRRYRIVRGMFDPTALREFQVDGEPGESVRDGLSLDDSERHAQYTKAITRDVGLDSFAQLVFLQHFVLTFDERRHLLFWDDRVAQTALYIGFGIRADRASEADTLRRTVERADSLARNLQWQATDLRKRLKDLESALAPEVDPPGELAERHRSLQEDLEEAKARLQLLEEQFLDVNLRVANDRANLAAATADYESAFRALLTAGTPVRSNPIVAVATQQATCSICGSEGPTVASVVQAHLDAGRCPFCQTDLSAPEASSDVGIAEVAALERTIAEHQRSLVENEAAAQRLKGAIDAAQEEAEQLAANVGSFDAANDAFLLQAHGAAPEAIGRFQEQIAELMTRKRQQLDRRNAARLELKALQDELSEAYSEAEAAFVPRFTQLAHEFLGLDLEIRLQAQAGGVSLLLTVQGTTRRVQDSLSESQRFFVDIALRMALSQQMTKSNSSACLYVDTPEGSLDIAYESRAGSMFGQFVSSGAQLIMTANINTSQLLTRLASSCGPEHMKLMRMTEWTSLSEVQSAEEHLFDEAYSAIEAALEAGG